MGKRGPRPTPAALQVLRGDPRKRGLSRLLDETLHVRVDVPALPGFLRAKGDGTALADEARAEWRRITPHLEQLGLISQIDRAALASYCFSWAVFVLASRKLIELGDQALVEATPSGYKQMGPWLTIQQRAQASLRTALAEFGLSPAARSRVTQGDAQLSLPGVAVPQEGGWANFPVVIQGEKKGKGE
jgi:P27 family predicted phage terminase small subunit